MVDFEEAPQWATHVMKSRTESDWQYWEGVDSYQHIRGGPKEVNDGATKYITRNWIRGPIIRQLEND